MTAPDLFVLYIPFRVPYKFILVYEPVRLLAAGSQALGNVPFGEETSLRPS